MALPYPVTADFPEHLVFIEVYLQKTLKYFPVLADISY